MISLIVNGQRQQLESNATLQELVMSLASATTGVAVAINANVIPKSSWLTTHLAADDEIEILTAAAGG